MLRKRWSSKDMAKEILSTKSKLQAQYDEIKAAHEQNAFAKHSLRTFYSHSHPEKIITKLERAKCEAQEREAMELKKEEERRQQLAQKAEKERERKARRLSAGQVQTKHTSPYTIRKRKDISGDESQDAQ